MCTQLISQEMLVEQLAFCMRSEMLINISHFVSLFLQMKTLTIFLEPGSFLQTFFEKTIGLSPDDIAAALENNDEVL
jgi:hypothetical protein